MIKIAKVTMFLLLLNKITRIQLIKKMMIKLQSEILAIPQFLIILILILGFLSYTIVFYSFCYALDVLLSNTNLLKQKKNKKENLSKTIRCNCAICP